MPFGGFQNYYENRPGFKNDTDNIALIGTLVQALYYLGAPFSAMLAKKFPKWQRHQIWESLNVHYKRHDNKTVLPPWLLSSLFYESPK